MTTQTLKAYQIRPATMDDITQTVEMFNAYSRSLIGADQYKVEEVSSEWLEPGFDLANDTQLVLNAQGEPVAYIEFWDLEPHVKYHGWGMVLPEYQHSGIGTLLLNWVEQRARQALPTAPQDARVVLHFNELSQNEPANRLLVKRGYQPVRDFYRMQIDLNAPPEAPSVPDGIVIRSIQPGEERIAIRCVYDCFHDHWGFVEEPFDNYANRWLHHLKNEPDYDPSLYFVATQNEQVVGASLCYSHITEDPGMAWVGTLGVRKDWRQRGLGLALLLHSFGVFYQRGKPRAGLGVDATSLTGAVHLYERAGMSVSRKTHLYELELRPGKDWMTQTA